ncbi:peptidase family M28 family [Purpureocillium lilacinum]|uniref:Peptidase family M28 family n=1 Tax=Purpureocillium lilacinum TaxID=33203 RepID=A0A179HG22_PURLI|nr:peptidase family M28 family [Purpureocillium lilacinum]OAQ89245.1 peptidase family M28 family [Purpureocillium lilacinum]
MVLEWLQQPFKEGDPWSTYVPIWTWLLQLLILAPVTLTVVGGQGLADVSAIAMTGVDGSSLATPFVVIGVLSIVVFLPFTPFIHRATHHVPVLALLVFVGASVYNFTAFPFSTSNRFKFIFKQTVDLDKGRNVVTLSGIGEYLYQVIDSIPEAGRQLESTKCQPTVERPLTDCLYDASLYAPQLVSGVDLEDMMTVNMSKSTNGTTVHIHLDALETRGCWLDLSRPISSFAIEGEAERDPRLGENPPDGLIQHIQVWRRGWAGAWKVSLQLAEDESSSATWGIREGESDDGMSPGELRQRTECNMDYLGRPLEVTVRCAWGDANQPGTIPALRRVEQYMPPWAIATRRGFGLVEMQRTYKAA